VVDLARPAVSAGTVTRAPAHRWVGLALAVALLVVAVALSFAVGARVIAPGTVLDALLSPGAGGNDGLVVRELRVPRTLIGLAAGAALGLAGTLMQGLTRNPLADPGLLGINAGASLAVVVAITWFGVTAATGYVWFAFAGAALAAVLVYGIGAARAGASPVRLALAGTAVTAVATSIITLVLLADLDTLDRYRFWSVGSLVGRDLATLGTVLPFAVVAAVLAAALLRPLNTLALGADVARGLGQRVGRVQVAAAVAVVVLCGAATAVAGPIVFVGLVVPHVARRFTGPDYRWIGVYSVLLGPALLLLADVAGRVIAPPGEVEAGLVVALLGAPALIALVRRNRGVTL
jgi:iron complex transport system permease protein